MSTYLQQLCFLNLKNDESYSIDADNIVDSFANYLKNISKKLDISEKIYLERQAVRGEYPAKTDDNQTVFIPEGTHFDEKSCACLIATQNLKLVSKTSSLFNDINVYRKIDPSKSAFIHTAVWSDFGLYAGYHDHELWTVL